jgi:hypothetical protein
MFNLINMQTIIYLLVFIFVSCVISILAKGLLDGYNINLIKIGKYNNDKLEDFPLFQVSQEEYIISLNKVNEFLSRAIKNDESCLSLNDNEINLLMCKGKIYVKPFDLLSENGIVFYYFKNNKLIQKYIFFIPFGGLYCGEVELKIVRVDELVTNPTNEELEKINSLSCQIAIYENSVHYDEINQSNQAGLFISKWILEQESKTKVGSYFHQSPLTLGIFNSDLNYSSEEIKDVLMKKIQLVEIVENKLLFHANRNSL